MIRGLTTSRQSARFTVVPPGPVTDRIRVELRLAMPNNTPETKSVRVRFYWDKADPAHLIDSQTLTAPPNGFAFARAWWPTEGKAGKRRLLYQIDNGAEGASTHHSPTPPLPHSTGSWLLEVIASKTPALPILQGAWIEPFAAIRHSEGENPAETEQNIRDSIDAMKRLGMNVLVIAYVEYQGTFFYPSGIEFYDRDVKRMARGRDCPLDVVGTVLSQADKNGMHVFLGIGRGGDTYLLWEFEKEGWKARNAAAIDLGKRVVRELWDRYHHHPSLYGWYLTHEMNDLAKASAYYNPLADFCHALSPDRPVMVAPAGTPIITPQSLAKSRVDIFAYQDAVGSGYVPYKNTFNPENRIAMLDEIFAKYRAWHTGSGKHLWADLEIWEMDGRQGYGGSYPPTFRRVKRQIEIEAKYVEMLTGYAWFGFLHPPDSKAPLKDPRARRLYEDYAAYRQAERRRNRYGGSPTSTARSGRNRPRSRWRRACLAPPGR